MNNPAIEEQLHSFEKQIKNTLKVVANADGYSEDGWSGVHPADRQKVADVLLGGIASLKAIYAAAQHGRTNTVDELREKLMLGWSTTKYEFKSSYDTVRHYRDLATCLESQICIFSWTVSKSGEIDNTLGARTRLAS